MESRGDEDCKRGFSCVEQVVNDSQKLQPFFPPLLPIQSINLRAATFTCPNGVKKDGILRKDVTLMKTMFDEYKGERLEEV